MGKAADNERPNGRPIRRHRDRAGAGRAEALPGARIGQRALGVLKHARRPVLKQTTQEI